MQYGLIGEHLTHSFSREVHNKIGDYPYSLCEIRRDMLCDFLNNRDFCGINVTIPYKKDVLNYLDSVSFEAKERPR